MLLARHNDVLLLAGDISDDIDVIRGSLVTVRQAFRSVFYIPGNHELWVRGQPGDARCFTTNNSKFLAKPSHVPLAPFMQSGVL